MKRILAILVAVELGVAAGARAETAGETWGPGGDFTHPGTLEITPGQVMRLAFDLKALPRGAEVHHASLQCFTEGDRQPTEPAQLFVIDRMRADAPAWSGKPLPLEGPWYRSFDATAAVQRWVRDPSANLGLAVARFEHFVARRTYLEVRYRGRAAGVPPQVTGVAAAHHDGQTFLRWTEHASYRPKESEWIWVTKFAHAKDELADAPGDGAYGMPNHPGITLRTLRRLQGLGLRDEPSGFQGIKPLKRVRRVEPVTYRVYRHTERIAAANIHQAERIAEVSPLTGYDGEVYAIHYQGEYINQREEPESVIPTYCYDRGKALRPGETMYVHDADRDGPFYYAVTMVHGGTENLRDIGEGNSLSEPVREKPATPGPVLQWIEQPYYRKEVDAQWWRFWGAPPYTNVPGRSLRVGVAVPQKLQQPCPLSIGTISGDFNVRGTLRIPSREAVTIAIQRQLAWLPALFYNQGRGTLRPISTSKVDYYSERTMLRMIRWIMSSYQIDRSKVTGSMLYFGLRHPEIFTWMQMGTYTTAYDYRWAPGGPSMPTVLGPKGIQTADGDDAWEMYSVGGYLRKHPQRDIPFLICISGTGKDSGHTCEFGWQDDPRGWRALLAARQTFAAAWSCGLPGELERALKGKDRRWDVTLPAFSNGSLDNNPGNGDAADGDYYGQINGWLLWDDKRFLDEPGTWEMTVWVISSCPEAACTVDITPRHCKEFRPKKGQEFRWTNTSVADGREVQSASARADPWGLVTLRNVQVTKGRNRVRITARP